MCSEELEGLPFIALPSRFAAAVDELIGGIEYEDEFYTQLLDKMVINDRENIDVYLKLLPIKWSYTVATASKKR